MIDTLYKHADLMNFCAVTNEKGFNKDKALEEALEFSEAIIKRATKHKENPKRPEKDELIKEYGDMVYRGFILLMQEFNELDMSALCIAVEDHMNMKLSKLSEYRNKEKYKLGL